MKVNHPCKYNCFKIITSDNQGNSFSLSYDATRLHQLDRENDCYLLAQSLLLNRGANKILSRFVAVFLRRAASHILSRAAEIFFKVAASVYSYVTQPKSFHKSGRLSLFFPSQVAPLEYFLRSRRSSFL